MSKPPQDSGSGPRIRARARGGTGTIRPEVVDALGELEKSLSEVAKWEQLLAGRPDGGPVIPVLPEGYVGLSSEAFLPTRDDEPFAKPESERDAADKADHVLDLLTIPVGRETVRQGAPSAADRVDVPAAAPLLAEFHAAPPTIAPADGSVLWAARTVDPATAPVEQVDDGIGKRRRNARVLSWAGAVVLVAGAALWFVPDRSKDDADDGQLPAVEITTTTRSSTQILTPDETVTPSSEVTTPDTTPATTRTTRKASTATTKATTPATSPPTTPVTVAPIRTVPGPPTTDTTVPDTTVPDTTSTTAQVAEPPPAPIP